MAALFGARNSPSAFVRDDHIRRVLPTKHFDARRYCEVVIQVRGKERGTWEMVVVSREGGPGRRAPPVPLRPHLPRVVVLVGWVQAHIMCVCTCACPEYLSVCVCEDRLYLVRATDTDASALPCLLLCTVSRPQVGTGQADFLADQQAVQRSTAIVLPPLPQHAKTRTVVALAGGKLGLSGGAHDRGVVHVVHVREAQQAAVSS